MSFQGTFKPFYLITLLIICQSVFAQNVKKEKMEQLNFLIGEWIGTTTIYEDGIVTREGSAYEKISYDLNKSVMVIELNTDFLQLRTIILFDENDQKYYYHRFSKEGAAVYPAEFQDGQLIVWKDDTTRFFFRRMPDNGFQEYGEKLIDGKWTKIFEDNFKNTE